MKKKILWLGLSFLLVTALVLTSCGEVVPGEQEEEEEITPTTLPAGMGRIEVRVTDAPPEYGDIVAIDVKIDVLEGVMVHKAATEEDGDGEWKPIPITGDNPFELLALQGEDVDLLLGWGTVPAGKYTQIKMTIEKVEIYFAGEDDPILAELPSGKLKFVRPFEVFDEKTTIIKLDFIADKSVVFAGADKVIFKPVVKLSIEYEVVLAPTVTTSAATDITTISATLNGSLDDLGSFTSVDVSFEYGTTSGALDNETSSEEMSETGTFSVALNELSPNITYYFRAKAEGDGTISYGDELSFTTLP